MKFLSPTFILFILLNISNSAFSIEVTKSKAKNVATNFYYKTYNQYVDKITLNQINATLVHTEKNDSLPILYVFNINDNGFVIVSAETNYTPIIGYSMEGNFPKEKIAYNFEAQLQSYIARINFIKKNNVVASKKVSDLWQIYLNNIDLDNFNKNKNEVKPLLRTTWDQNYPYNYLCPIDSAGPGKRVYAGCVATAMATIMHYYHYPKQGQLEHSYYHVNYGLISAEFANATYKWDIMPNTISLGSEDAILAIAELQHHCGVAVDMNYSPNGSGAYSFDVPNAIQTYFNYSSESYIAYKDACSNEEWINLIKGELDNKKPLYYSGYSDEGGHAFNCDGYRVSDGNNYMFHFNFGWSGNANGYYTIESVNGFNSGQAAIINFVPNADNYPYKPENKIIKYNIGNIYDYSGPFNYKPNTQSSWLIMPADSVQYIELKIDKFDLANGDYLKVYDGGNENSKLLAELTKGSEINTIKSSGSKLFIKFTTDASEEAEGFEATFKSLKKVYCSTSITLLKDPTGIVSDGSGENNYNNNSFCNWLIDISETGNPLEIKFAKFNLAEDDYLIIYDHKNTSNTTGKLTGASIPNNFIAESGKAKVIFKSDILNNAPGFEFYYSEKLGIATSEFEDLSYGPNPTNNLLNIKLNNVSAQDVNIELISTKGEVLIKKRLEKCIGLIEHNLFLSHLSKGVYFLKIKRNNNLSVKKIIKF